ERFGRFPHRNDTLGRESTAEEIAFLATPNSSFCFRGSLEFQPLEDDLGNGSDHKHDDSPVAWSVHRVALVQTAPDDALGDLLRRTPQWSFGECRGHGGVDKSRPDVHYLNIAAQQASAQALQENGDHALGAAIDIV